MKTYFEKLNASFLLGRKQLSTLLLLTTAVLGGFAQDEGEKIVYKNTIRTGLSFTPGFMVNGTKNVYITGSLEYYLSDRVSVEGACLYFANSRNKTEPELKINHHIYTGFNYHFLKNRAFDLYMGLQPGFVLTQVNAAYPLNIDEPGILGPKEKTPLGANPMISVNTGFNFFAAKYFHLFVNGRFVAGRYLGGPEPYSLSEVMLSFGMGLNANFFNRKKK